VLAHQKYADTYSPADVTKVSLMGAAMRRRLEAFIPIVMLAVLVQLMAPIAAFRVVAYATTDPLYLASICSGMTSASDTRTDPAGTQHHHGDCCAYCVGSHGGAVAVDPPPLIFVNLQRQYQQISWLEATEAISVVRIGSNSQARAPPLLT
jgi:hypothetical protein